VQELNYLDYSFLVHLRNLLFVVSPTHKRKRAVFLTLDGGCAQAVSLVQSHLSKGVASLLVVEETEVKAIVVLKGLTKNSKAMVGYIAS
jgi:hypothetical protein